MALIVLGAGATRGASFCQGSDAQLCKPPLDGDFFTQLQRIGSTKHKKIIDDLLAHVVTQFGHNFSLGLERVFTVIEFYERVKGVIDGSSRSSSEMEKARENLLQALAALFEESLTKSGSGSGSREMRECEFHRALVDNLKAGDSIISFNYDCLIDWTLKEHGAAKWNPRYGYHLPLRRGPGSYLRGEDYWKPDGDLVAKEKTISLLKLHGSMHFQWETKKKSEKYLKLKERPYTKQRGSLNFEIIPPEWNKDFEEDAFGRLWKEAARKIRAASTVVVVGYSFPLTDLHTESLFRVAVKRNQLKHIVLVNPDREARRRGLAAMSSGMTPSTRVHVFNSLTEFSAAPRPLWDS